MCAGHDGEVDRDVHLQLKHGVEAKNYDDVSICVCMYILGTGACGPMCSWVRQRS